MRPIRPHAAWYGRNARKCPDRILLPGVVEHPQFPAISGRSAGRVEKVSGSFSQAEIGQTRPHALDFCHDRVDGVFVVRPAHA